MRDATDSIDSNFYDSIDGSFDVIRSCEVSVADSRLLTVMVDQVMQEKQKEVDVVVVVMTKMVKE